jgi:hypothetical protein
MSFADTLSMVLLALNCIVRDHRNRNLDHYVKKPSTQLAEEQRADGSFGNLHSTALAVQVCQYSYGVYWNLESNFSSF